MNIYDDIIGDKIGRLTVLEYRRDGINNFYKCVCDCGNVKEIRRGELQRTDGRGTRSCGCIQKEIAKGILQTHGLSKTRFYNIWSNIKIRIYKPNSSSYPFYGAVGVKMDESWHKFGNFKNDMYESYLEHVELYGEKETTIERIDPAGNYEKANCKWATNAEQGLNQRRHKRKFKAIHKDTGEECIYSSQMQFARDKGISHKHIGTVLNGNRSHSNGWTFKYIDDIPN